MRTLIVLWIGIGMAAPTDSGAAQRSWHYMTTGNGHGYQLFDRKEHKVTMFLEHPYRYVAPENAQRKQGIGRRDLAHDIYFGLRSDGQTQWLQGQTDLEYEAQTNIIHGSSVTLGLSVDTYYFGPFGYEGNGMLMLMRVRNTGTDDRTATLFAKPNLKFGAASDLDRRNPGNENETIQWNGQATPPHATETGPGGGHAIYIPLGGVDATACGSDGALYNAVAGGSPIGSQASCTNQDNQVFVAQRDVTLAAGESAWWGMAVLFVNDNPVHSVAASFKDERSVADILSLWNAFAQDRGPQALHDDGLAEFEAWRANKAPAGLNAEEQKLWRQSETVLRLGQIREPLQSNKQNHGMIVASLPYGEWHTGWVRDAAYAVDALAMTGHTAEARKAMNFFLGAEGGFFQDDLNGPYRVSVCRYFGNGLEEGDFNDFGPNIETDGWGLILHSAAMVLHYECDLSWLDEVTWRGDTVFEALEQIAQDIENHLTNALPQADTSIWEVHWVYKQVFAYTAACQIRGLFDFADIAEAKGRAALATKYREIATEMLGQAKLYLVNAVDKSLVSHLSVVGSNNYVDGSTVEFLTWHLVAPDDPIYAGTMAKYNKLLTQYGGYRRLEPNLSLTGQSSAGEYDLSEWILLDLRISDARRRMGQAAEADLVLNKVTNDATANDYLIPELYEPISGEYRGSIPMVGYGAGAWMMSQLERHGHPVPFYGDGLAQCGQAPPTPDVGGDTSTSTPDAGPSVPSPDVSPPAPDDGPPQWNDGPALICAATNTERGRVGWPGLLLLLGAALLAFGMARRGGHHA